MPKKKRGRPLGTVKIEGDWESAVGQALGKARPAGGWPKSEKPKKVKKRPAKRRK